MDDTKSKSKISKVSVSGLGSKPASKSTILSKTSSARTGFSRAFTSDFKVSVESYMLEGMMETLGDVLERQLVHINLVTRSTQTDWQWRLMAERWKHGIIRFPRSRFSGVETSPTPAQDTIKQIRKTIVGKDVIIKASAKSREKGVTLPSIEVLRECTEFDKCIDTCDLQFDPYDPHIQYVKSRSTLKPLYIPPPVKKSQSQSAEDSSQWFLPTDKMIDL